MQMTKWITMCFFIVWLQMWMTSCIGYICSQSGELEVNHQEPVQCSQLTRQREPEKKRVLTNRSFSNYFQPEMNPNEAHTSMFYQYENLYSDLYNLSLP